MLARCHHPEHHHRRARQEWECTARRGVFPADAVRVVRWYSTESGDDQLHDRLLHEIRQYDQSRGAVLHVGG